MTLSTDLKSCLISLYMRLCSMIVWSYERDHIKRGTIKQIYKETDHRTVSFSTGTAAKTDNTVRRTEPKV